MRHKIEGLFLAAILGSAAGSDAWPPDALKCYETHNVDICTRAIASGNLQKDVLSSTYFNRGFAWYMKREYARAAADFDEAIKVDPNTLATFFEMRGLAMSGMGDYDRAIADFSYMLKLNPENQTMLSERGYAFERKGEYERAIADLDLAIKFSPRDGEALFRRAIAWRNKGNLDRAIADLDAAIDLNNFDLDAIWERGLTRYYRREFKKAAGDFSRLQKWRDNEQVALWVYLAEARSGIDGKEKLIADTKRLGQRWPAPIVALMTGTATVDAILAQIEKESQGSPAVQLCQASYYVGQWHVLKRNDAKAVALLRAAEGTCIKNSAEYLGALHELKSIHEKSNQ